jgi:tetratricopeptide (TPR) repeat protein
MALITYRSGAARELAIEDLRSAFQKNGWSCDVLHCADCTASQFVDKVSQSKADALFVLDPDRVLFGEEKSRSTFWVNFQRETLVGRPGVQIWWLRPLAAVRFGQQLPDLSRFFLFREELSDEEPVEQPRFPDLRIPAPLSGNSDRGRDLLRRALQAAGDSKAEQGRIWLELGLPAVSELIRAGLTAEAADGLNRLSEVARRPDEVLKEIAGLRPNDAENGFVALGEIYNGLGRFEDAAAVTDEAVRIDRILARDDPGVFLPRLARSLDRLAHSLYQSGDPEAALPLAEEAVRIWRERVGDQPGFLPEIAASLNNLGNALSDLGRRSDALLHTEEAVRISRELARQNPKAFGPDLAAYLSNLANQLGDLGRPEEALVAAEEAVHVYRGLSKTPSWNDLLPTLLDNVAMRMAYLGRLDEAVAQAEEATLIHRRLTQYNRVMLPNLAKSLNNTASILLLLTRYTEALPLAQESVDIHRELAKERPGAFMADLARSLRNLAKALSQTNRSSEALGCADEAVNILRELARGNPDVFLPDLAAALDNLAYRLSHVGRTQDAVARADEALGIYRQLVQRHHDVFLPALAESLAVCGDVIAEKPKDAIPFFEAAIRLLAPFTIKHPIAQTLLLRYIRERYSKAAQAAGIPPDPALLQ